MSYARSAVTRMTLDMSRLDLQRSETVTQGDTNRRWEVTLINGGAPFRLPPNWTAALTGIKPDGTGLLNGCSVVDGKIIYDFAAGKEIATCVGSYPVQFDVWDEVGDLVASPKIYVNVLADVRPRAELDSKGQYTLISGAIAKINGIETDVDILEKTANTQGDDIASLKKKVTTAGTITIHTTKWSHTTPHTAYMGFPSNTVQKGQAVLFMPLSNATKEAAAKARLSVGVDEVTDGGGDFTDYVLFVQAEEGAVPAVDLDLGYIVLRTAGDLDAMVALIGVDAYGDGGGTASGVDEDAVKKIINSLLGNVENVRQYSASNPPPYPVTSVNDKTGVVKLNASDVGARPSTWTPTASEVGAVTPETVQTLVNDLARKTTQDLANYYTKSQTFTKDEINTLVSAIPKFKIEVVTSLPTSNISDTTVYLVKSGADSSNLYTEYIRANGVWERIGTQTVDLTGYATEEWVNELLASYIKTADIVNGLTSTATNKPLSAAQGMELKKLINLLDAGKITTDEANDLIANALKLYTPTDELPDALPTPHKLIINGVEFNGSETIQLDLDELPVVAYQDEMTDTNQLYVLESTAHIWRYREVKGSTNWLRVARPTEAETAAGYKFTNGYELGLRLKNSDGSYVKDDFASVSGFIPCSPGEKVRIRNIVFRDGSVDYGSIIMFFDGNKNIFPGKHIAYGDNNIGAIKLDDNGDFYFTVPTIPTTTSGSITATAPVAYFRMQFSLTTPNPDKGNVAVGEEMTDYETGYRWVDTGIAYTWGNDTALLALEDRVSAAENEINEIKAKLASSLSVPDYWQDHIAAKIAEIQSAQAAARQRCVTWATVTDIHDDSNAGGTGRLIKAVCDQCGINAVLCLGDYSTRATKATADRCRQSMGNSNNILAPVADRLLGVRGNHDGGYKTSDAYLLKPSEVDSIIQYPMATDLEITYDAVGSGYYATDKAHKVRYIMLNTDHRGANPDSTVASDGSSAYPYMSFYRYTQVQMDMVKEALTTIPNDSWTVIVASHVPPIGSVDRYGDGSFVVDLSIRLEDYLAMRKLLNAYVNRTAATVSFSGSATWDKISLSVDFTAAKGHLAEYQSGHLHRYLYFGADHIDPKSKTALGFPIRTVRSDGFNENFDSTNGSELDDAYANQRVLGTTTEHSFVVCVHNIDTRETTCIHVGAQEE